VFQVVGPCKTEASQKPVPLDPRLAEALHAWRRYTSYRAADDWVFASPAARGQKPYWGQCLMRTIIRPAAAKIGITQHIGWHTFRHTYSSLLRANRTDIKVTQELLRHASSRVTLDTYTQAVTLQKRKARAMSFGFCARPLHLLAEKRTTCSFSVPTQTRLVQAKTLTTARSECGFTTQIVPFLCLY
jgi:Phage integrase family